MPNKRRCRNRQCNAFFLPDTLTDYPRQIWCSEICKAEIAIAYYQKTQANRLKAKVKAEKAQERKNLGRKRDLRPISHWLDQTQRIFNEYIRRRDENERCISCGTGSNVQYCAGHFRTRGAAGHLRFDELNVHKQCNKRCNLELSGNIAGYRPRLIEKIGLEAVEALENNNTPKSWTREELSELRKVYRNKIRALERI